MRYSSFKTAQPGIHHEEDVEEPRSSVFTNENESFANKRDVSGIQATIRIEDYIQEDSQDQYSEDSNGKTEFQEDKVEFESNKTASPHAYEKTLQKQTQMFSAQSFRNDPIPVSSIDQLMDIFGVKLNNNYFLHNGQVYEMKIETTNNVIKSQNVLSPSNSQKQLILSVNEGNYQETLIQLQNSDESFPNNNQSFNQDTQIQYQLEGQEEQKDLHFYDDKQLMNSKRQSLASFRPVEISQGMNSRRSSVVTTCKNQNVEQHIIQKQASQICHIDFDPQVTENILDSPLAITGRLQDKIISTKNIKSINNSANRQRSINSSSKDLLKNINHKSPSNKMDKKLIDEDDLEMNNFFSSNIVHQDQKSCNFPNFLENKNQQMQMLSEDLNEDQVRMLEIFRQQEVDYQAERMKKKSLSDVNLLQTLQEDMSYLVQQEEQDQSRENSVIYLPLKLDEINNNFNYHQNVVSTVQIQNQSVTSPTSIKNQIADLTETIQESSKKIQEAKDNFINTHSHFQPVMIGQYNIDLMDEQDQSYIIDDNSQQFIQPAVKKISIHTNLSLIKQEKLINKDSIDKPIAVKQIQIGHIIEKNRQKKQVKPLYEEIDEPLQKYKSEVIVSKSNQDKNKFQVTQSLLKLDDINPTTINLINNNTTPLFQELQEMRYDTLNNIKHLGDDLLSPPRDTNANFAFNFNESINIAFMFASPIHFKDLSVMESVNSDLDPFQYFQNLQDSVAQTENHVKISYSQATVNNLYHIMNQNPEGIHFVGSAHKSSNIKDGYYLILENESGESELITPQSLSEIITSGENDLEFAFVISSHSSFLLGHIFHQAGVKHVICAKSYPDSGDDILQTFILTFYGSLYKLDINVCDAFRSAQEKVRQLFGDEKSDEFLLFIKQDSNPRINLQINQSQSMSQDDIHECASIVGPLSKGQLEIVDEPFIQNSLPSQSLNLVGTNLIITKIVSEIIINRIVTILGYTGMGKSSILQNILHFLSQRNFFASGIIYLNLRGVQDLTLFLKHFVLTMQVELPYFQSEKKRECLQMNTEQSYKYIMAYLKSINQPMLFAFDNSEQIQHQDKDNFEKTIEEIMTQNPFIKVILTTQIPLSDGSLANISQSIKVINNLEQNDANELFQSQLGRKLSKSEIDEIFNSQPYADKATNSKNLQLQNHEIFSQLAQNTQSLILTAKCLKYAKLSEIFQYVNSKQSKDVLKQENIPFGSSISILRLTIQFAIDLLKKAEPQTAQFFYMLGLLKTPASEKQIRKIWGLDFEKHLVVLRDFGIVSNSFDNPPKIVLSSLVQQYSESSITLADQVLLMNDLSRYLNSYQEKIYRGNSKFRKSPEKQLLKCRELKLKMLSIESNLLEIVNRLLNEGKISSVQKEKQIEKIQIQKIEISKVYDNKMSRTPSQPSLKKLGTAKLSEIKIPRNVKTRLSLNAGQKSLTLSNSHHKKKTSWVNEKSNQFPIPNSMYYQKGKTFSSIKNSHKNSRNNNLSHQNTSQDKKSESYIQNDEDPNIFGLDEEVILDELPPSQTRNQKTNKHSVEQQIAHNSFNFQLLRQFSLGLKKNSLMQFLNDPSLIEQSQLQIEQPGSPKNNQIQILSVYKKNSISITSQNNSYYDQEQNSIEREQDLKMHDIEKTMLKYMMNLFLFREMEQLGKFIEKQATNINGCLIYQANLLRIKGLLHQSQQKTELCIEYLKKSKRIYEQKDSIYGLALSRYSIGLFQKKLLTQQNTEWEFLDAGYQKLIIKFEKALQGFKQINHLIGQALCHNQISQIHKTRFTEQKSIAEIEFSKSQFNDHQNFQMQKMLEYQDYPNKKKSPHVKRVQGPEFSLMLELVLDQANINLFPVTQKYELQAIQEDELEESVMFSDDTNIKESLKDQADVIAYYDSLQQELTPRKFNHQNQQEISRIYSNHNLKDSPTYSGMFYIKSGQSSSIQNSSSIKKLTSEAIHIFEEHTDQIQVKAFNEYKQMPGKPPKPLSPDSYNHLSDRKRALNQDLLIYEKDSYIQEEDLRSLTCSPQESSINQINQTDDLSLINQQAYFSQNSKRVGRMQSQLEVVEEETEQSYFDIDKHQLSPRLSVRSSQKLKKSLDMVDKNKSTGSIISYSTTVPNQSKHRNSLTDKVSIKKPNKPKVQTKQGKVLQIDLKMLKQ
eukprot:403362604